MLFKSPAIIPIAVVFPAPFEPKSAKKSPCSTLRLTPLSALSLLAGALGVGIGFGFQKVTDNLISGLTILVEEPIKVGDRVEVGDVSGDIVNISLRSTTIITNAVSYTHLTLPTNREV